MSKAERIREEHENEPHLKLDLGCGKNKKFGFIGVDSIEFEGVDIVTDLRKKWPWNDGEVKEIHASHVIEHFDGIERVHIFNEMYRVLGDRCKATIITPHWASCRAYGDFTHKWPPVSEFLFYYLSKEWRAVNAPHNDIEFNPAGYNCDFEVGWGYSLREDVVVRNAEYQQFAMSNYKEVCMDTLATLTRK
jgi:hypothetical protein